MRYSCTCLIIISIASALCCSHSESNKSIYTLADYTPKGSWVTYESHVLVFIPESDPPSGNKRALMINLHGCTMSKESMRNLTQWDDVAYNYGMIVAIPDVPNGGRTYPGRLFTWWGCWDFTASHYNSSRSNGDAGYVISLAERLMKDANLNIDPKQIYVSGFSSGASMSVVLGCLAPDIFSGIGVGAGNAIGAGETLDTQERINTCLRLADFNQSYLSTQITSIYSGLQDLDVQPGFFHADVMDAIYQQFPNGPMGTRLSLIIGNTGHTWPKGIPLDYTEFLTRFLFSNNKRCGCN